jgi:tetratricopeptide (TPR) repeat protein
MPFFQLSETDLGFPPAHFADEQGMIAVGGDLSGERLLTAYRNGIYFWFGPMDFIKWWSPDPRLFLLPEEAEEPATVTPIPLEELSITYDQAFEPLLRKIQEAENQPPMAENWVTEEMIKTYLELFERGYAHSLEIKKYDTALDYYDQALYERQQLAEAPPDSFLPDVCATALNMATLYQSRLEQTADMAFRQKGLDLLPVIEQSLNQIEQDRPAIVSMRSELEYFHDFFYTVEKASLEAQLLRNRIDAWQEEQLSTLEIDEKSAFQKEIITALEQYLTDYPEANEMQEQLSIAYGHQAWLHLLKNEVKAALENSEKALSVWDHHHLPKVNRAHALLLSGQTEEALQLYHAVKDEITVDKKRVRTLIKEDFEALRRRGLEMESMKLVEEAL